MSITVKTTSSSKKTLTWLQKMQRLNFAGIFNKYGQAGVAALSAATPVETAETANSWYYEIEVVRGSVTITWKNRHVDDGAPIALLLQYGHGTGTGGYVPGRDYINPAIRPIFDQISAELTRVVNSA